MCTYVYMYLHIYMYIDMYSLALARVDARQRRGTSFSPSPRYHSTPDVTHGNRKSRFHEFAGELTELTSKVKSHYLSRSQWLQLPNPTAPRII